MTLRTAQEETDLWRAADRVGDILSRLKHRDRFTFRCQPHGSSVTINAVLLATDSRSAPGTLRTGLVEIGRAYSFPVWLLADMDDHDVAVEIWRRLIDPMERHEAAEWFRLDGELVVDPHDPTSAF